MVQHGEELIGHALGLARRVREEIESIDGIHVDDADDFCGPGLAAGFDPLPCVMDIGALGTTGYRAGDWMREHHHIDLHLFDHRRISAQFTHADDAETADRLLTALNDLVRHAGSLRDAPGVDVPAPGDLRMEQAALPRDAYFDDHTDVPVERAAGRIPATAHEIELFTFQDRADGYPHAVVPTAQRKCSRWAHRALPRRNCAAWPR